LECPPSDLMTPEPDKVAARRSHAIQTVNGDSTGNDAGNGGSPIVTPRFGKPRSTPPL